VTIIFILAEDTGENVRPEEVRTYDIMNISSKKN